MEKLYKDYTRNVELIKSEFDNREDLILREVKVGKHQFAIFYMLGLSDAENLSKLVIKPIISYKNYGKSNIIETLQKKVLFFSEISTETEFSEVKLEILRGKAIIIADNSSEVIALQSDKHKERSIAEPPTNAVIKGPRSGFVENLKTNLASIKNILHTTKLKTINLTVGKYTQTAVAITYIDGIADKKVVKEIEEKIKSIDIDGVIDSYYIGQFLETRKKSIFKQVGISEKPDIIAGKMLEGRVAIVVDGSPMVLTLPYLFYEDLQSSNDYYSEKHHVSFVRIVRILACL